MPKTDVVEDKIGHANNQDDDSRHSSKHPVVKILDKQGSKESCPGCYKHQVHGYGIVVDGHLASGFGLERDSERQDKEELRVVNCEDDFVEPFMQPCRAVTSTIWLWYPGTDGQRVLTMILTIELTQAIFVSSAHGSMI